MTSPQDEQTIRAGYAAYAKGDVDALLGLFSPDLVWTYLDAIEPDPKPLICRGLVDLERALRRQSAAGLKLIIEELVVHGRQGRDHHLCPWLGQASGTAKRRQKL